jgi:hypothetical protein
MANPFLSVPRRIGRALSIASHRRSLRIIALPEGVATGAAAALAGTARSIADRSAFLRISLPDGKL